MIRPLAFALLLLMPLQANGQTVVVPRAPAPRLDGSIASDEWSRAVVVPLTGSGEVRLMHDGADLHLAFRWSDEQLASVCVGRHDEVRMVHSSMALGEVVYRRQDDAWRLAAPFTFEMRDTTRTKAAENERRAYFVEHRWVASTVPMGRPRNEIEMRIALDLLDPDEPRIAFATIAMSGAGGVLRAPADLTDDCAAVALVQGMAADSAVFRSAEWLRLELANRLP